MQKQKANHDGGKATMMKTTKMCPQWLGGCAKTHTNDPKSQEKDLVLYYFNSNSSQ